MFERDAIPTSVEMPFSAVHQLAQMPTGSDNASTLLAYIDASLDAVKQYL